MASTRFEPNQPNQCESNSLPFFPEFLAQIKSITRILRNKGLSEVIVGKLRARQFDGLADLVHNVKHPNFQKWRWGTFPNIIIGLDGMLRSLADHFEAEMCGNVKDADNRKDVDTFCIAVASGFLWLVFRFMVWMMNFIIFYGII